MHLGQFTMMISQRLKKIEKNNSVTIYLRNLPILATEMYKTKI